MHLRLQIEDSFSKRASSKGRDEPLITGQGIPRPATTTSASVENLGGGERKLLTALAQYSGGRSKTQLAVLTVYSIRSSGFNNNINVSST